MPKSRTSPEVLRLFSNATCTACSAVNSFAEHRANGSLHSLVVCGVPVPIEQRNLFVHWSCAGPSPNSPLSGGVAHSRQTHRCNYGNRDLYCTAFHSWPRSSGCLFGSRLRVTALIHVHALHIIARPTHVVRSMHHLRNGRVWANSLDASVFDGGESGASAASGLAGLAVESGAARAGSRTPKAAAQEKGPTIIVAACFISLNRKTARPGTHRTVPIGKSGRHEK